LTAPTSSSNVLEGDKPSVFGRLLCVTAFAAILVLRVILLAGQPGNYDTQSYEDVASSRLSRLYSGTAHYNYSPLWGLVLHALRPLAAASGVSFVLMVGWLLLLVDAATSAVLYRLAGRDRPTLAAVGVALLYFSNPVAVLTSTYYVQFDNLSILFLLLAVLAVERRREVTPSAVACLSASLLAKHVTWFHPILFVKRGRGMRAILPYALFAASFLPWWRSWNGIRKQVLEYRSVPDEYGVRALLPSDIPNWIPLVVFAAGTTAAAILLRKLELRLASLLLFLVIVILLPGIAIYYLFWPIAIGSLLGGAGYAVYTIMVAAFMIGSPDGLGLQERFHHLPDWSGPWWAAVFWLLWEIRRLTLGRNRGRSPD